MEEEELTNLIKNIKRNKSKTKLLHYLKILRRIVDDKRKFTSVRESGGLRLILTYLPKNSLEIVDLILSIVGNCCMDRECSKEVVKYNGLIVLCDILKKSSQDSVICRVLRILGNIAQFDNFASEIYKYDVVPTIVKLLNKSNEAHDKQSISMEKNKESKPLSMDTEAMAVRSLRILWQSYSNRQNMINEDVIRAVSMVLITNTQKWLKKEDVEHLRRRREKLLENVLKCLLLYSKWGTFICAEQMLANGLGFKSLVSLVDLFPYSAIKCLTNLSPVAKSRADIDISAAVKSIIDKIKSHLKRKTGSGCPNEIINAFCLFSRHPMNCSEVKRAGGLPIILDVLKNCRSRKQEFQIINSLPGFFNDEEIQEILVTHGIVKILIDCLERNLRSKTSLNESHTYVRCKRVSRSGKKKECLRSPSVSVKFSSENCNEMRSSSPTLDNFCKMNIFNQCLTPSDSESSVMSSPCSSPSRRIDYDDDDDSVNYSPVCSETEEMEVVKDNPSTLTPNLSPQDFEESDDDNCETEKQHFESSDMQEKSVIIMLIVLSRTLHMKPYPKELHAVETIETLLKYLRESKHPKGRVTNILSNICSNVDNLLPLILNGSVYMIHSLTQMQHDDSCGKCRRMRDVGDELINKLYEVTTTDKAKTVLCEKMTCDNENYKINCIIITPYIVKVKSLLRYIMDSCGGLNLLITQYQTNLQDRTKILTALNKLACRININNPCLANTPNKVLRIPENFNKTNHSKSNNLTIKLDDGQVIIADRDFLIENVDYFKAMLSGSFREADQDCVRLRNVSRDALNFLLFLLITSNKQNREPIFLDVDLSTVLEVIKLTDSYLLENLTEWLTSCVECYMINKDSASQIYRWSIESGTNFLRIETIAYLLTGKMYDRERQRLCESILECGFVQQLSQDFQQLIDRYLKIR